MHPLANAAFLLVGLFALGSLAVTVLGSWEQIKEALRKR